MDTTKGMLNRYQNEMELVNPLSSERYGGDFKSVIFYHILMIEHFLSKYPNVNDTGLLVDDKSTLVQDITANNPLPEPMLTKMLVAIWRHWRV